MITKEEFEKAQKIVYAYKDQVNKEFIFDYRCICCKNNKVELFFKNLGGGGNPLGQEFLPWKNGAVGVMEFGYGSRNDGAKYYIAICDQCIEDMEKSTMNTVVNFKKLKEQISDLI